MKVKIISTAFLVIAIIFYCLHPFSSRKKITYQKLEAAKFQNEYFDEEGMDSAMVQEFEKTKDPATGQVPKERLIFAAQVQQQLFEAQKATGNFGALAPVPGISWMERGPNNIGGRTRSLLYDANDPSGLKVWAGSVGGGLWYCNNIEDPMPTWNSVGDFLDNLAVTTIAQDPTTPQTMYFGTGEGWYNIDAIRGLGIYKSMDGGLTWAPISFTQGNPIFYFIQKLVITSTGAILAATRGGGIQRSGDGGLTWTQVAGSGVGMGSSNSGADIVIGADGRIYASTGIFDQGGIYRSDDDGISFSTIYTALFDEQRIALANAPSNPNVVYALLQKNTYGIKNIMKTNNATDLPSSVAWTSGTNPTWCDAGTSSGDFTRGQAWYDLVGAVDPYDENTLFIGGVDILKTTDGGVSWAQVSQWASGCAGLPNVHADIHAIVFKPTVTAPASEMLIGCDGGVYFTGNAAIAFAGVNTNYNVTQYYSCAAHPIDVNYFLAGAQDNGTQKYTSPGINSTTYATGGDGGYCHIDQNSPNIQMTAYTGNALNVSTNGGASFIFYGFPGGSFINPSIYDNASQIFYGGFSTGSYIRWANPAIPGPAFSFSVPDFSFGTVTYVAVSPLTANRIYFGLNNGAVVRIDNAQTSSPTSTVIKAVSGPISVSGIAIDPANEDHALVTYSNYGITHVYESINATSGAPTWTGSDGNLPDMPVRWVIFDPRNSHWALIATELGVWSTDNLNGSLTDWQPTNTNFAQVSVDMLKYRSSDRTLAAATHGRGLFTTVIPTAAIPAVNSKSRTPALSNNTAALNAGRFKIVNNPFTSYVDIQLAQTNPGNEAAIRLLDLGGKEIYRTVNKQSGNGRLHIDFSRINIPVGIYLLEIRTSKEFHVEHVLKQ